MNTTGRDSQLVDRCSTTWCRVSSAQCGCTSTYRHSLRRFHLNQHEKSHYHTTTTTNSSSVPTQPTPMTMNKLALIALLLCFASLADAALKDCRVYVKNSTPVPLVVQGEREAPEVRCTPHPPTGVHGPTAARTGHQARRDQELCHQPPHHCLGLALVPKQRRRGRVQTGTAAA